MLIWPHPYGLPALGHTASTRIALRKRLVASWGKTEVFASRTVFWDLTRVKNWRHTEDWSIRYSQRFPAPYGLRLEAVCRHPYGEMRRHHRRGVAPYGDVSCNTCRFVLRYGDLAACRKSVRLSYWLTREVAARHSLDYAVRTVDPVAKRLTESWSLLDDARLQAVVNNPELVWDGRTIRIVQATLSCDEESPVWIAQIEIAELADFAVIGIGDTITLALGLESFVFVVDGKTLSRESVAERRCELSAVSPVALLDSPFSETIRYYQPTAESAEAAVASLIGTHLGHDGWQLPRWTIPAGRLMLESVTPLAAARNIVAAVGGIVECNPDGTVVCRRRHPVSIPQYSVAIAAHSLFDVDVISARSQIAPSRGFNRVTIANEDGAAGASSDRIEFVADADDDNCGTVRAYLAATRLVMLTHTGHAATVIASLGTVTRNETETVEFVDGRASTRYPVAAINSAVWQHTDLGAVSADGQSLVAATAGFSLLRVTYIVASLNWRVALSMDEDVQFVLVDT